MKGLTRTSAVAAGCAVVIAMATPALANAQGAAVVNGRDHIGASNLAGGVQHVAKSTSSTAAGAQSHRVMPLAAKAFPSANSTVVGSVGFVDGEQVGYFWSAARGDSVSETLSGPPKITKAALNIDVPSNGLVAGAEVDWVLSINGKDVGKFVVASGDTGPIKEKYSFSKIKGGSYDVEIRVTNEVASGDGAITLRYAGAGAHSICLKK